MKTEYKSDFFEAMSIVQLHPDGFRPDEGVLSEKMIIPPYKGFSVVEDRVVTGGIMIIYQQLSNVRPIMMEVIHDFPFLTMIFELDGGAEFVSNKPGMLYHDIPGGMQRLMFFPQVQGALSYEKSRKGLEITISLEYFNTLFEHDLSPLGKFGRGIINTESVLLHQSALPITTLMRSVIYDILNCKFSGSMKRAYLQSKVAELLMLQLEQLFQLDMSAPLKRKDRDTVYRVRELIEKNISQPLTIPELAVEVGINTTKLKQLFKQEFGNTIFGYLTEIRLDQAKRLLEEGELPIGDIAHQIGYKHPQHFTAAFKRKFGYTPSEIRS